jgi:hypothetical protein
MDTEMDNTLVAKISWRLVGRCRCTGTDYFEHVLHFDIPRRDDGPIISSPFVTNLGNEYFLDFSPLAAAQSDTQLGIREPCKYDIVFTNWNQ